MGPDRRSLWRGSIPRPQVTGDQTMTRATSAPIVQPLFGGYQQQTRLGALMPDYTTDSPFAELPPQCFNQWRPEQVRMGTLA